MTALVLSAFRARKAGGGRAFLSQLSLLLMLSGWQPALNGATPNQADHNGAVNVLQTGAKGDGKTKDTHAIQDAIDGCHRNGGGTVLLPAGTFLSGSLHLASGVALHLDHGATLRASPDAADFDRYESLSFKNAADEETSFFHHSLIWAEDSEKLAVTGTGTIDCNRKKRGGPKAIAFKRCRFVTITGITIVDCPNYCVSLLGTDYVRVDGITILNGYSDGIDPDCCHHVRISNCHIESWDDAIVPKASFSLGERRSTENVTVTNCILATNCNAFKLGTESGGDFRNIAVSNCLVFARPKRRPPISGISLLSVDGSNIEGVTISNISMADVGSPVFLRLGNRGRDMKTPTPGTLKNVIISEVVATRAAWPCIVAGIPDHPVEGVTLKNLRINYQGRGTRAQSLADVPEHIAKYPSADMFGKALPAFGLFCRHARDLQLSDIHITTTAPDERHAVLCNDVVGLLIDCLSTPPLDKNALLRLHQVRDATVRGCGPKQGTDLFVQVSGNQSGPIRLIANDLRNTTTPFEIQPDVPKACISEIANLRSEDTSPKR